MQKVLTRQKQPAQKRYRYFAYGSNMLQNRLEQRVGRVIKVCTGYLRHHKLDFSCGNMGVSFANVVPSPGNQVFGVVYRLTLRQLQMLDSYEVYYQRENMKINTFDTAVYTGLPFHTENLGWKVSPLGYYVDLLKKGYLENNHPKGVEELEALIESEYSDDPVYRNWNWY